MSKYAGMFTPYYAVYRRTGFLAWVHTDKVGPPPKPWYEIYERTPGRPQDEFVSRVEDQDAAVAFVALLNKQWRIEAGFETEP